MWCGGTPLTVEHLIPRWVSRLLETLSPSEDGYDTKLVVSDGSDQETRFSFEAALLEIPVRAVCTACNSGWMNTLENQVRPILTPLITGARHRVSVQDLVTLAHWSSKTVVLVEHVARGAVVLSPSDLDTIRLRGVAPFGYHMRLAYVHDPSLVPAELLFSTSGASLVGETDSNEGVNAFAVTLSLGHVAICVHGGPGVDRPSRWKDGSHHPLMLWPPTPTGVSWPPVHPVVYSRDDLKPFHEAFYVRILNPDFRRPDALT
jgi:hypothetical protein